MIAQKDASQFMFLLKVSKISYSKSYAFWKGKSIDFEHKNTQMVKGLSKVMVFFEGHTLNLILIKIKH